MSQPLHAMINGHWSDITHRRTDVYSVAEYFNSDAHLVSDMTVMVIELFPIRDPRLPKVKGAGGSGPWRCSSLPGPVPAKNKWYGQLN